MNQPKIAKDKDKKKISFIIVNFNSGNYTKKCVESIYRNLPSDEFEVIVADNDSSDDSTKNLYSFKDKIKLLINDDNHGFARANNRAASKASAEYLFFLNSDTVIKHFDIKELITKLNKSDVGIVAPKLVLADGSEQAYAYGEFLDLKNLLLKRGEREGKKIEWLSGAAIAISRENFDKVNGFDEDFFMYFEDMDLCKRLADIGLGAERLENSTILHYGGASLDDGKKRKELYYNSQDLYIKKHHSLFFSICVKILRGLYKFFNKKI
ncbi:glycosyltransferase [Candidatus Falkowbacteria bacterium]|nr:glycosyltransferase [Candidatus Falkowbacteria bacterium]